MGFTNFKCHQRVFSNFSSFKIKFWFKTLFLKSKLWLPSGISTTIRCTVYGEFACIEGQNWSCALLFTRQNSRLQRTVKKSLLRSCKSRRRWEFPYFKGHQCVLTNQIFHHLCVLSSFLVRLGTSFVETKK